MLCTNHTSVPGGNCDFSRGHRSSMVTTKKVRNEVRNLGQQIAAEGGAEGLDVFGPDGHCVSDALLALGIEKMR